MIFDKAVPLNKKIVISAGIGIIILIVGISFALMEEEPSMEVEDILDRELKPEEITPEIQDKLDEIEKINLENEQIPDSPEHCTVYAIFGIRSKRPQHRRIQGRSDRVLQPGKPVRRHRFPDHE